MNKAGSTCNLLPREEIQGKTLLVPAQEPALAPTHPTQFGGHRAVTPGRRELQGLGLGRGVSTPGSASSHPLAWPVPPLGLQSPIPSCSGEKRLLFKLNYGKREAGGSWAWPAARLLQDFADFPKKQKAPQALRTVVAPGVVGV